MNKTKSHKILTNDYLSFCKLGKKLDFSGALIQFSLITVLLSWRPAKIGYYQIAAPILLFLTIFSFFRSISKFRSIEGKKTQTIVDGLEIEKQAAEFKFFHNILEKFNLKQILLTQLVANLVAFGFLGHLTYQFLIELSPSFAVPQGIFILLFSCALSGFGCKEYYGALKPLTDKKNSITTQNEENTLDTLNDADRHRAQAIEYKKLAGTFSRNNMLGVVEMLASLGPLYYISKTDAPYTKPLGCLFTLIAVFLLARDYTRTKNLDTKVVRLVLKGLNLEKKKPSFDRFFHNILSEFSVVKIVASRSICTVICVYHLSFSLSKILVGTDSAAGEHKVLLGLIGATIGIITCTLYYSSYKEFDELKK